ncbi:hypothetical protein LTR37_000503 [Vermiconidia calcicola]|uniref:Uncharacterized protein n=1 Tax=Vermiconidia calcicola TaxID=1690605 RepID=A0ACC3NZ34_9PEZI|nr:hypothetical protein LTR37_000503 [Vermiconidia calcicola]
MAIFNRRTRPANSDTAQAVDNEKHGRRNIMSSQDRRYQRKLSEGDERLNKRPRFGQWIKVAWPDILTMIVFGAIGLGVYHAPPAPSRSFPVFSLQGDIVYPQFAYPLRREVVPIWAATVLAVLVPIVVFLIMQIRIRSFWDVNNAITGLLYSLITAAVFQALVKWLIGGLRPHFLEVCKPMVPIAGRQRGNGFGNIMYDRTVCTGDKRQINDALESMPSGHTTAAFAGFIFLYLYLNAKLKIWSNYHPAYWKLIVTYMPVLGAVLIGGALTIDEYHNWYDIVAGALIGTIMAFSSYRMVYASVWDFRFNHVPLVRHLPFTYANGSETFDAFRDAMWTRQAGWGSPESDTYGGAPFDASNALHGTGGGGAAVEAGGLRRVGKTGTASSKGHQSRPSISAKPILRNSGTGRGDGVV